MRGASAFNHDIKHLRSPRLSCYAKITALLFSRGLDPIFPLVQSDFRCNPPTSLVYV